MKSTSHLVTAAAAALAFGFPAGAVAYANAPFANMPPAALDIFNSANATRAQIEAARRSGHAQATEHSEDNELARESIESIERSIAQHRNLIEVIRADATREQREPTEREEQRIADLQQSLAVYSAENERRAQSRGRRVAPEAMPGGRSAPGAHSAAAAARNGVVFAAGTRDFSTRLFGPTAQPQAGSVDDYFNSLATRTFDPRNVAKEGIGVDGGFDVPTTWFMGTLDQALQGSEFAQRCRIFPADSNSLMIPMLDTANRAAGVAGLIARWSAEAQQQTPQTMKWKAVEMKLKKTFILSEASSELVEDGIGYAQQLGDAMSIATAQTLDAGILFGTGVGMPLGLLNSDGAIQINPQSGQVADTVLWENLVDCYSRLAPACQKRATWFVSPSVLPSLMRVKVPGTDAPALLSGGFNDAGAGAPALSIFGRTVVVTEISPQLGDKGDIVFADLSQYGLLMKKAARMEQSIAPKFDEDVISFRMIARVNGTPLWPTPITPYNNGPTLTFATYLAARA